MPEYLLKQFQHRLVLQKNDFAIKQAYTTEINWQTAIWVEKFSEPFFNEKYGQMM